MADAPRFGRVLYEAEGIARCIVYDAYAQGERIPKVRAADDDGWAVARREIVANESFALSFDPRGEEIVAELLLRQHPGTFGPWPQRGDGRDG